jgi:hypothetical protein
VLIVSSIAKRNANTILSLPIWNVKRREDATKKHNFQIIHVNNSAQMKTRVHSTTSVKLLVSLKSLKDASKKCGNNFKQKGTLS